MVQKIFARASNLLHNMSHQAQVAFDQDIAGVQVAGGGAFQIVFFLLGGQRLGEAAALQLQRVKQPAQHQPYGRQHCITSKLTLFGKASPNSLFIGTQQSKPETLAAGKVIFRSGFAKLFMIAAL